VSAEPALRRAVHRATARFASGVLLLTARDASLSDWGITVVAFLPVSEDPPLVAVALRADAGSTPHFAGADRLALSVLGAQHEELAARFASGRPDRFVLGGTERLASGLMAATGALALLEAVPTESLERGDHVLVVGAVERAEVGEGEPLVYAAGEYRALSPEDRRSRSAPD
jgi:flavin reductase ActVB